MTTFELRVALIDSLADYATLDRTADLLRPFAATGGSREEARAVLEDLRSKARDEDEDDAILDVLDIVEGFVSPHLKVWR